MKPNYPVSLPMTINGCPVEAQSTMAVINPATEEIAGYMPSGTIEHLDQAVAAATAAFASWRFVPDTERQRLCFAVSDRIEAASEELAGLLTLEQGKPLNGTGSRFEVGGAVAWSRYTAGLSLPPEILGEGAGRVELHRRPLGVIGSITPWNWPVMIAIWHLLPAIRAGNTVVLKPSPLTPLSTLRLAQLLNEVLPSGIFNVVTGPDNIGAALSCHPGIAKVTFTGSTATGRAVMAAASDSLKRLTLELGGNDAGIILPDADPDAIAENLFWGAFINNGQTCAALKRLYVPDALHDAVVDALAGVAAKVPMGDGFNPDSLLGPVQNRRQFQRVHELITDAKRAGGRILCGGSPRTGDGFFYPVTLVTRVEDGCRLVDEEQFGPVLPIIRYGDLEDAIARANSGTMGLGGSVWSRDIDHARAVAGRLQCGSTWINSHGAIRPDVPFGGVKQSGFGVQFGLDGLKEVTSIQAIHG
ncbi:MAG: aldehyde dehydrogenase family protein [Niveispirillum sp.]|uniref:aldehyde dehydrogenase family protein n=1 Tax=Niveispirillum sp. TaxID=1917217 RepID=UPI003BA7263C